MEKKFSDEMIRESYGEIIEGLILNGDYFNERYAISLIRTILECGVNSLDLDKIEYVCMKAIDIKNLKKDDSQIGYRAFDYSSNKTIVEEAIRVYDKKCGNISYDVDSELLGEYYTNQIHHSR